MAFSYKKSPFAPDNFPNVPPILGMEIITHQTGLRYKNRNDLVCVHFDNPAITAAVFTKSSMPSAPVDWSRALLKETALTKCLVVNAGNANAFTGKAGISCCDNVADSFLKTKGYAKNQIFQASTGVIGEKLDGIILGQKACEAEKVADFQAAAKAIMTTDTFEKASGKTIVIAGKPVNIAGIAKGSGMIAPNMGTMLSFIFTDADIEQTLLQSMVQEVANTTFNAITVDGDTSTSDTFAVFATQKSGVSIVSPQEISAFHQAFTEIARDLALQIVKDGEGLTKFVTINVKHAADNHAARKIGLSIANSPLVKTAFAGHDPNWGRIIAAVGKSGEQADRDKTAISIGGFLIAEDGEALADYDETPVAAYMKNHEIVIDISVGKGHGEATVYTTDLTHDYIEINADYRS